jgi:transcriptional regulator with XRE-family HTH domain
MAMKRTARPRRVTVWYRGIPYSLDLVRCRRALVDRQVNGEFESMEGLADVVGISRSTASRFFSGRPTSLAVTLKLLHALHLDFTDVATPEAEDDRTKPEDDAA